MSDEDKVIDEDLETQIYTAEFKDGRLQIVDMPSLDNDDSGEGSCQELPEPVDGENHKIMQVLDSEKGLMQLDMLNFTLVRCEDSDGESMYRLVTNAEYECERDNDSSTVTCVLQNADECDTEELSCPETYVMVSNHEDLAMLETDTDTIHVELEPEPVDQAPSDKPSHKQATETTDCISHMDMDEAIADKVKSTLAAMTPEELLQRAKALKRLKNLPRPSRRGRRRRGLPPPHELLASPNFKLFLYSCKQCSYKCNAIKELTAHRQNVHSCSRGGVRSPAAAFQCARCPYRAPLPRQLTKHVEERHCSDSSRMAIGKMITLDSQEVADADVLVCGACGFECPDKEQFKIHITTKHM